MTTQEAYERIRAHFSRQDAVLAKVEMDGDDNDFCVYRKDEIPTSPVRCAFGVLIPDELYDPKMENVTSGAVLDAYPELKLAIAGASRAFIAHAQSMHDSEAEGPKHLVMLLDKLAVEYELKPVPSYLAD